MHREDVLKFQSRDMAKADPARTPFFNYLASSRGLSARALLARARGLVELPIALRVLRAC
jgi:hypothetical protein